MSQAAQNIPKQIEAEMARRYRELGIRVHVSDHLPGNCLDAIVVFDELRRAGKVAVDVRYTCCAGHVFWAGPFEKIDERVEECGECEDPLDIEPTYSFVKATMTDAWIRSLSSTPDAR